MGQSLFSRDTIKSIRNIILQDDKVFIMNDGLFGYLYASPWIFLIFETGG